MHLNAIFLHDSFITHCDTRDFKKPGKSSSLQANHTDLMLFNWLSQNPL